MSIDSRTFWASYRASAPTLDDPEAGTYTCPECDTPHDTQAAEADCLRSHARAEADRLASEIGPARAHSQDGRTLVTDGGTDVGETERKPCAECGTTTSCVIGGVHIHPGCHREQRNRSESTRVFRR